MTSDAKGELVKLGTLKNSTPLTTPENLVSYWSQWDKYIHIEGVKSRLGKILPQKIASFKLIICLAAYCHIDKEQLTTINLNLALADKY